MRTKQLVLALACAVLCASSASAATIPVSFGLDIANSNLAVLVSLNGTPLDPNPVPIPLASGALNADVEQSGTAPPALSLSNVFDELNANDFVVGGALLVQGAHLTLGLGAGPYPTNGANPGLVDLSGLPVALDGGVVLLGGNPIADFGATPVLFNLPNPSLADINEVGGPVNYTVTLGIPVDVLGGGATPFGQVDYHVTGYLVFEGLKTVPEPGTIVLAAMCLMGLVPLARKAWKR